MQTYHFLPYSDNLFTMALAFSFNFKYFGLSFPGGLGSSVILGDPDRKNYMETLISFLNPVLLNSQRSGFVRCWHAKTDGSAASVFHDNCDGKGPTVTIIKSGSYIFGAYTDASWHSSKYQIVIFFPRGWYSRKNSVGCATRFTKSIPSYNQNQRLSLPYL